MDANKYTYRIFWSDEDEAFVATCAEFPSLSHIDDAHANALTGMVKLVASVLLDLKKSRQTIPEPLFNRNYSGVFKVRIPAEVHRSLTIQAAESNVSLNRLVSAKLAR